MKNLLSFCSIALLTFLLNACGSDDPNHLLQNELRDEIMVVHDEVMPKMGDIHKLKKNLKKIAGDEQMQAGDPIFDMLAQLENADEGMMSWMAEFKQPSKLRGSKTHEEIMAYLAEEKLKIEKVRDEMLSSIAEGTELLESFSKAE